MKGLSLCVMLSLAVHSSSAQLALPCIYLDNNNVLNQNTAAELKGDCIHINTTEALLNLEDDHERRYVASSQIRIDKGTTILPENGGILKATLSGGELTGAWMEPLDTYVVPQYEKVEWGVILPAEVEAAIDNWISNDQNGTSLSPALNPFDPEQIDVRAEIIYQDGGIWTTTQQPVFGFFYIPYERDISNADKNLWDWTELSNAYRFRIRWSPQYVTNHRVSIKATVPGFGEFEIQPFEFASSANDPRKSFVSVTNNHHYFKTTDGHVFFPVGMNIQESAYDCGCDKEGVDDIPSTDNFPCQDCYDAGFSDWCCGLSKRNQSHRYKEWDATKTVREMCLPVSSYLKLNDVVDELVSNGANAFRFLIFQSSFDIEFEEVNNYYDRLYQGWELDKLIEHCHDVNMRIQLNMQYQFPIGQHAYSVTNWDWYDTNNCDEPGFSPEWGYKSEFNLIEPKDFFSSEESKDAYKKKLRYFIARWGYSPNIYLLELFSEINGVGSGMVFQHDPPPCTYYNNPVVIEGSYDLDLNIRKLIGEWHNEMAGYIKNELGHTRHLISTNYAGNAPMNKVYNDSPEDPCDSQYLDATWNSPNIDVICWNSYEDAANNYEQAAEKNYENMACGATSFFMMNKPVVYGENGNSYMGCDHTGFIKDLVCLPFCGHASSGMSWDENEEQAHWHWMGKVHNFLETEFLDEIDLNNDSWVPGYMASESGGTSKAETIYLRRTDPGNKKLIGVIMNRSWNWFTIGQGGGCDIVPLDDGVPNEEILPPYMMEYGDCGDSNEPLKVESMGILSDYRIRYFDPANLEIIDDVVKNTGLDGKLRLANYALLTLDRPFVFFKAWRDQEGEQFMPPLAPQASDIYVDVNARNHLSNSGIEETLQRNQYFHQAGLKVWPNPSDGILNIEVESETLESVEIYNLLGQLIKKCSGQRIFELDVSFWPSGVYLIRCPGIEKETKFVKL